MAIIYTKGEEIANSVSHGIGIIFGLLMGVILMKTALSHNSPWAVAGVSLYLFGMLSSYITSTWYHAYTKRRYKELLRKFDHAAIYLHIAGTYSPITLIILRNESFWGWGIFTFVWLCAIIGFILSFTNLKEHSNLETICFITMGATVFVAFKPLINALSILNEMNVLYLILAGGASYIAGAVFYSFNKISYMHSAFHLFCLGGSVCHAIAIYKVL